MHLHPDAWNRQQTSPARHEDMNDLGRRAWNLQEFVDGLAGQYGCVWSAEKDGPHRLPSRQRAVVRHDHMLVETAPAPAGQVCGDQCVRYANGDQLLSRGDAVLLREQGTSLALLVVVRRNKHSTTLPEIGPTAPTSSTTPICQRPPLL